MARFWQIFSVLAPRKGGYIFGVLASCGQWGVALPLGCNNPKCGLRILRIEKERERERDSRSSTSCERGSALTGYVVLGCVADGSWMLLRILVSLLSLGVVVLVSPSEPR